jgi:K+-transporting ATPase ATPase A chain
MNTIGWIQLAIFVGILLAITKPLGLYLIKVLDHRQKTFLDPLAKPFEKLLYRLFGVNPDREQNWKQYTAALLIFSAVTAGFTYGVLRLQNHLPGHDAVDKLQALQSTKTPLTPDLAFNTAVSFTTNTNWQSYSGENAMSYFSQMVALASHNFWSATVGIAVAAALVRGISRDKVKTLGNFWVDLVRLHLYLLIPICIVFALVLVSQGMIQNFKPYTTANVVDQSGATPGSPAQQFIPQGPMASQVAIKMLGTNGGGFTNANAAHPFENPNPLSNFLQILSIFAIPSALTYYLGRMVKNQNHGWAVWATMFVLFMAGVLTCWWAESAGNPRMHNLGISQVSGNMEGKETRFGMFSTALFVTVTTDASCGAVNAAHDSLTPIGGLVPMFNMHLGEVVFGGVGAGLYGMLVFVIIAIFIAGLMVGRTPEYLGKKIEAYDVKLASLSILVLTVIILGFSAWAVISSWGTGATNNSGPHGFSEIHYAYTSGAANNGSAFAGLSANEPHWNTTLGVDMLLGRFFMIVPILALAGSLAAKKRVPQSLGSFPVAGPTFVVLLLGTVVIVGALTFVPALSIGPIVEHFLMHGTDALF